MSAVVYLTYSVTTFPLVTENRLTFSGYDNRAEKSFSHADCLDLEARVRQCGQQAGKQFEHFRLSSIGCYLFVRFYRAMHYVHSAVLRLHGACMSVCNVGGL